METIKFYSVNEQWGEFSNFALYPIKLDGKLWPTTEHYFQAQKIIDATYQEKIRKANTPMLAATLGRHRKHRIRKDWNTARNDVMNKALLAKFTQYPVLRELLLSMQNAKLIEHTESDSYWDDGGDGKGKNKLGQALMQYKEKFQKP